MTDRFLNRREAAARLAAIGLPISPTTLASAITRGNGPPCYRFGRRALYREGELLAWAEARLRPTGRRTPTAAE